MGQSPLWPGGFFLYNLILPRPVLFQTKEAKKENLLNMAARGVAFELSSESSFYSTLFMKAMKEFVHRMLFDCTTC